MEGVLRELDLSLQQYNVLAILADAGEMGVPTLTVADRLLEKAPGVTRLMDRLEARSLVARTRGEDRRQIICRITDPGQDLVTRARPLIEAVEADALGKLSQHEAAALAHFLQRIARTGSV